jgi:hypothetical protein
VDRAVDADLRGLHWVKLIVYGRSRASQIEDLVNLDVQRETNVVPGELKSRIRQQMMHVVSSACVEVIDTQHFIAAFQQPLTEV